MKGDLPRGQQSAGPDWVDWLCLALIVAWGLGWQAPDLGHPTIRNWDEAFHQAAARGTYQTFFTPHLYPEHLYPSPPPTEWWSSTVWLHKPTGPFWFAAAVMKGIGVTPLALRLGGLLGQIGAALALYLLARKALGSFWPLVAALGFLALPFGWKLTQGFHFGDATDGTLVGWVSLAMLLGIRAAERRSWRWALAAGGATGVAFLCKSALGLVPLGTFAVLTALAAVGFCRGPRWRELAAFTGALLGVAAPWNLYAAWRWPEIFQAASGHTLAHLGEAGRFELGPWARPWDAIFNEVLATEVSPLPHAFLVLAGGVLAVRAWRRRELPLVAAAIWLWATWLIHSWATIKVPAQVWSALPAAFLAIAALTSELYRSPGLAGATLGALAAPWLIPLWPALGRWRAALPAPFEQTRTLPGLVEGLLLAAAGAALSLALLAVLRRIDTRIASPRESGGPRSLNAQAATPPTPGGPRPLNAQTPTPPTPGGLRPLDAREVGPPDPGGPRPLDHRAPFAPEGPKPLRRPVNWVRVPLVLCAPALLLGWLLWAVPRAQADQVNRLAPELWVSHSAELGPALDAAVPKRAVVFQDLDSDPPGVFEVQSLMFWSGRIVYRRAPDPAAAERRGYHPYLVSPAAEPFAPVPGVPPQAWLRAYDLKSPAAPSPLPEGVRPLEIPLGTQTVVGWAAGPIDGDHHRYAFYLRPTGVPGPLAVTFHLKNGGTRRALIPPEAALRSRHRLARSAWYLAPAVGPPLEEVGALQFGSAPPFEIQR